MKRAKCSAPSRQSSAQTALGTLPANRSLAASPHSSLATRRRALKTGDAFTMIELLVVIAIIAILAGLTLSTLGYVNRKAADSRARAEVAALSAAIESYKLDFGSYPPVNNLYAELVASTNARIRPTNTNKVYFEPTPNMTTNLVDGPFIDPWGSPYAYITNPTTVSNVGFFDLISYAGNSNPTNARNWIRN